PGLRRLLCRQSRADARRRRSGPPPARRPRRAAHADRRPRTLAGHRIHRHSRPEGTAPARQPLAPAQEPPVTTSDAPRPRPVTPRQAAQILAERDPVLARLRAGAGPPVFPKPTDTHFATLVRSVTYQQLAGAAARAIHGRLILALDGEVTPERLLATPAEVLRAAGLSARKAASLQDLATKVLDGTVVLDSRRLAR